MSQFSEIYYLYSTDQNDGVGLLRRAWLRGFVYPSSNNWVTIIPNGSKFQPIKRLINSNRGVLLHLINAEDHGWSVSIYDGKKRTFHYECTWEEEIEINQDEYNRDRFVELANTNPNKLKLITPLDVTKIFYISDFEQLFENHPVNQIAELLRLEHFEWMSYDYLQNEIKENPNVISNKGVRVVNRLFSY